MIKSFSSLSSCHLCRNSSEARKLLFLELQLESARSETNKSKMDLGVDNEYSY